MADRIFLLILQEFYSKRASMKCFAGNASSRQTFVARWLLCRPNCRDLMFLPPAMLPAVFQIASQIRFKGLIVSSNSSG